MHVGQNFCIRDVLGQMPENISGTPYLLPNNFPSNFSQACVLIYINRMKDC